MGYVAYMNESCLVYEWVKSDKCVMSFFFFLQAKLDLEKTELQQQLHHSETHAQVHRERAEKVHVLKLNPTQSVKQNSGP